MVFSSSGFKCSIEFVIFYGFAAGLRRSSDYSGITKSLLEALSSVFKHFIVTCPQFQILSGCHLCQCIQNESNDANATPVKILCITFNAQQLTLHNLLRAGSCIHSTSTKLITTEKLIFHNKKSAKIKQRSDALCFRRG